jgi:hypothetical protein
MRKFHSIAALYGDGLLAIDPHSELFIRHDGMTQSGTLLRAPALALGFRFGAPEAHWFPFRN